MHSRRSPSASLLLAYPAYLGVPRLPAADDQRHHHRSDRSAALRRAGAAAPARHGRLCRPLRRRAAAQRPIPTSSRCIVSATAAGRLRRGDRGHHQAQMARRGRRARRRPGRRDGQIEAVARTPIMGFRDDVVVRIRPDGRRRAHRRALGLALRPARPRHQCLAHPQPAGGRSTTTIDARTDQQERLQRPKKPPAEGRPASKVSRRSDSGP